MKEITETANNLVGLADDLAMMLDEKDIPIGHYVQAENVLEEAQKLRQKIEDASE